jgi:hypothetical protein
MRSGFMRFGWKRVGFKRVAFRRLGQRRIHAAGPTVFFCDMAPSHATGTPCAAARRVRTLWNRLAGRAGTSDGAGDADGAACAGRTVKAAEAAEARERLRPAQLIRSMIDISFFA